MPKIVESASDPEKGHLGGLGRGTREHESLQSSTTQELPLLPLFNLDSASYIPVTGGSNF